MQTPIVVFDHIAKTVTMAQQGVSQDKKVEELLATQRAQVTSSGSSPSR
jgi:hypothetical protein